MEIPPPPQMLERIASLPAGRPLLRALGDAGAVYLVGGTVRDLLLGGRPLDLDLAVEGDAAAVARQIGDDVVIHDRFGTSTVRLDGFSYDIARTRAERYPRPGALPEVFPAGIGEDLGRRDFTANALAIALTGPDAGALRSAPLAIEDLEGRRLRILHERSFLDDPTRLMRLARYAARLGFEIEPETRRLAEEAVAGGALATVSGARVGAELRLLAREPDPVAAMAALRALGLDQAIHPRLGLQDPEPARRALELLPEHGRRDLLVLAAAVRGVPAAALGELLDALAFEAAERGLIVFAASEADALAERLAAARRPSEIAEAVGGASPEAVALAGGLGPAAQAREWLKRLRHVKLDIDGGDLLDAGVPQGPSVGRGLDAALAAKLDGIASSPEEQLAAALRAARATG